MAELFISQLLPDHELREIIQSYRVGLESIYFSISENLDHFSASVKKEKELLRSFGNPPLTLHGPFLDLNPMTYDSRIRQVTEYRFQQAYEAAAALGAKKIVYHSCMIPTVYYLEGWAERMADFWTGFLRDKQGITVCMENVFDYYAEPFLQVYNLVSHPDFGICLDAGHAQCYSRERADTWAGTLQESIRHVHVHDNDGSADLHLALGEGKVPWRNMIPLLAKNGPSWTIECADREAVETSIIRLRKALPD